MAIPPFKPLPVPTGAIGATGPVRSPLPNLLFQLPPWFYQGIEDLSFGTSIRHIDIDEYTLHWKWTATGHYADASFIVDRAIVDRTIVDRAIVDRAPPVCFYRLKRYMLHQPGAPRVPLQRLHEMEILAGDPEGKDYDPAR